MTKKTHIIASPCLYMYVAFPLQSNNTWNACNNDWCKWLRRKELFRHSRPTFSVLSCGKCPWSFNQLHIITNIQNGRRGIKCTCFSHMPLSNAFKGAWLWESIPNSRSFDKPIYIIIIIVTNNNNNYYYQFHKTKVEGVCPKE